MCAINAIGSKVRIIDKESFYFDMECELVHVSTQGEETIYSVETQDPHGSASVMRFGVLLGEFEFIG